ncbi:hypothetical protein [Mizugakiibacter sediminis]|nr:hypothetical protein [Mizugakiibacter sediminis]
MMFMLAMPPIGVAGSVPVRRETGLASINIAAVGRQRAQPRR